MPKTSFDWGIEALHGTGWTTGYRDRSRDGGREEWLVDGPQRFARTRVERVQLAARSAVTRVRDPTGDDDNANGAARLGVEFQTVAPSTGSRAATNPSPPTYTRPFATEGTFVPTPLGMGAASSANGVMPITTCFNAALRLRRPLGLSNAV